MSAARAASLARARVAEHLAPRRQPVQQRARDTVDLLLDTAAALLEEVGVEGFNTNVLAARAAVRVRTVYRYFPNKLAVITALAERMAEEWGRWFDGFEALADPRRDWRSLWVAYVDAFVGGIRRVPGGLAIRRAMRALPELQAIDRRDNGRLAGELAVALDRRGSGVSRRRLTVVARVLVETAVTVLDLALFGPPTRARELVDELKCLQIAYIEAASEKRKGPATALPSVNRFDHSKRKRSQR
jgi:AcrR family transcriptional regulator